MKTRPVLCVLVALLVGAALTGCRGAAKDRPTFSLAWSEYPSWSVFGVAHEKGLINGDQGKLGRLEEKWGVDLKLELLEYEPCINAYQAKNCDAVCITNMDVLNPALSRNSVAILPTSTSAGADACIVVGLDVTDKKKAVEELRKYKVYGLPKSVSEYAFARNVELLGDKWENHQFAQMDPADAARAMQGKVAEVQAIMVWNPFVLQTLKTRKDSKVLFDSSTIPEEIIDMVVVGEDALGKTGGREFACCLIDTYYEFNKMLADPKQRDELLVALGKKFSSLNKEEMEKAVEQTRFYKTPEEGLALLTGDKFPKTMAMVVDFCLQHKIVEKSAPKIGYGSAAQASGVQLRFDPSFIQMVKDKK